MGRRRHRRPTDHRRWPCAEQHQRGGEARGGALLLALLLASCGDDGAGTARGPRSRRPAHPRRSCPPRQPPPPIHEPTDPRRAVDRAHRGADGGATPRNPRGTHRGAHRPAQPDPGDRARTPTRPRSRSRTTSEPTSTTPTADADGDGHGVTGGAGARGRPAEEDVPPGLVAGGGAAARDLRGHPLVVRARRRSAWDQELAAEEGEVSWLARELLPELRRAASREEVAGGWTVSRHACPPPRTG